MHLRLTTGEVIPARQHESILVALKRAGVYLIAPCGGKGTCGKCKVVVHEGRYSTISRGKLTAAEREAGMVLSCLTLVEEDLIISIPKESRLVVGDKIALARSSNLPELLRQMGVTLSPLATMVALKLPPPSITDNISDLERLKRTMSEHNIGLVRFAHAFAGTMGSVLRSSDWDVTIVLVRHPTGFTRAVGLLPGHEGGHYGIAVDIGTTTVVVSLIDLAAATVVDVGSTYNSQIAHGDDVITRIVHATEGGGLNELKQSVVDDINAITRSLAERNNIPTERLLAASIAGNTVMSHIFWGIDPGSIREEPYIPAINQFPIWNAASAGLAVHPGAPVFTAPCVASYVGGDIVAGVLASRMHHKEELALFMDIGTNGEIAIGNNEWLMTAACSAGPCFEGSGIRHGMRATTGAVESVRIDPVTFDPACTVIGGGQPVGLCGSAMIDLISEFLLTGLIDQKGKFVEGRSDRVRRGEEGLEYVVHSDRKLGKEIVLTEVDIENIVRAKAAVYSGITTLLSEAGLTVDAIARVYIAGGFGNYLNISKAIIIGMLPDLPESRFTFLGNTSATGACLCLLSEEMRREALTLAARMTYIELSVSRLFMDEYISALFLPHTNMDHFPTVAARLMESLNPVKHWLRTHPGE